MRLTTGKIVAGKRLSIAPPRYEFTVQTEGEAEITMGNEVQTFAFEGFDGRRLKCLLDYLVDRPSLMDEKEVKDGVAALKCLFPKS